MKNLFHVNRFLLYFLTLFIFFIIGASIAGSSGAAEGQGLAGGAIILFYGALTAVLAFIAALFVAYYASDRVIVKINQIMGIVFFLVLVYLVYRFI